MRTAEGMLAQSHNMGIIGNGYSQSQSVAQQGRQRNDTFPREIRRVYDATCLEVRTRRTDTHRTNGLKTAICLNQLHDTITQCRDESTNLWIILCGETVFRHDVTSYVHNSIGSGIQTDIYTHYSLLHQSLIHNQIL